MKVLLVDDEQKFALMLSKRLELRGFDVKPCFSGEEALEVLKKGARFDAAVLDIKMPGIGGVELKQKLSLLDPNLRFVFLTGHGSDDECIREEDIEMICLPKPLQINTLIETLHRIVGESGGSEKDKKL
ncbi:MAG: response regulator [Desulfobacteraceae bacterium]|jgi:two-component system, OmpR family, response regulator